MEALEGIIPTESGLKTGIPPKSAPEAYLFNVLNGFSMFDQLILNLNGVTDFRVYFFVRNVIMKIPEDEIRMNLLKALDIEIKRIDALEIPNEERSQLKILTAQNAMGQVMSYLDEYIGIAKTVVIADI